MLFSYNWLKEFLPDLKDTPREVAELLTMHSFETDVAGGIAVDPKVAIAKIKKMERHPNADRLQLVTVDTGSEQVKVVCGADNISEGDMVPYAPEGTWLKDEEGESFELKKAKIRGVESAGMLASSRELGLGDWHKGIYILPADVAVGDSLSAHIVDDVLLEADITPNRAHDCLSHIGLAKEVAAIKGIAFCEPEDRDLPGTVLSDWKLSIEDDKDTPRYQGILFEGMDIKSSPLWLQARLWAMGARPINNIVDVTNYVMFEVGNPSHAFDTQKLSGKEVGTRRAKEGEEIALLNGETYRLGKGDMVVTSKDKPVALAGIMGGVSSQVSGETGEMFLEVANFRSYLIQESTGRLKIESESAARFKKQLSPCLVDVAAGRIIYLLEKLANANVVGMVEHYSGKAEERVIDFDPDRVGRLAGTEIDRGEVKSSLESVGCEVVEGGETWKVRVPLARLDLEGEHDLAEEVIRLVGLHKIESGKVEVTEKAKFSLPEKVKLREALRVLLVNRGFTETINYSFEDEVTAGKLEMIGDEGLRIKLTNPPAPERSYLRQTLVPQLVRNLTDNKAELLKRFSKTERALFEIGQVFRAGEGGKVDGIVENEYVGAAAVGEGAKKRAREAIEAIIDYIGVGDAADYLSAVKVLASDSPIVRKLGGREIAYFELDLDELYKRAEVETFGYELTVPSGTPKYLSPSKYPATYRDISILVDPKVSVGRVQEVIERVGGEMVQDVDLFDLYEPSGVESKGLAFHVAYQSREKTLAEDEVASVHNGIVEALKEELGVEVRE